MKGSFKIDNKYRRHGLIAVRLLPNSGDLNPIETVWARLRRDLAQREFEDLKHDKIITTQQFKQRVAQLLHSYSLKGPGERVLVLREVSERNASKII